MVAVPAAGEVDLSEPPLLRFRGSSDLQVDGTQRGVWVLGENGPEAVFSLAENPTWLLAGTMRSVWFVGDLQFARSTRVTEGPRPLPPSVQPRLVNEGVDWSFDVTGVAGLRGGAGESAEAWVLWVVDRVSGEALQMAPTLTENGRLHVPGGGVFHNAPVDWVLDRQVDGVSVGRARGSR